MTNIISSLTLEFVEEEILLELEERMDLLEVLEAC